MTFKKNSYLKLEMGYVEEECIPIFIWRTLIPFLFYLALSFLLCLLKHQRKINLIFPLTKDPHCLEPMDSEKNQKMETTKLAEEMYTFYMPLFLSFL